MFDFGTREHAVPNVVVHHLAEKRWLVEGHLAVVPHIQLKGQCKHFQ